MNKFTLMLSLALIMYGCGNGGKNTITATGTIEATESTVSAQVGGIIEQLRVDEGSAVQTGDTLAILDATDWIYQMRQADANATALNAQYQLALEGTRKEDLLQAEANYKNAESDLQRMRELWQTKSISQKQYDDAETRYTLMKQTWEKMKKGLREEEIETARAHRNQAQAQLESLRKKVSDCIITSPITGVVTRRYVELGELASPGIAIANVANLKEMNIMIYVSEVDLPKILLGQSAEVTVDAFQNRIFKGRVVYISSIAEFTPKNIQTKDERVKLVFGVKVKVENPDGTLKGGIPADVTLR